MKKLFSIFAALLFAGSMMATESQETLTCSAGTVVDNTMTFTTDNFTIVHAKGTGSSFASYSPWRIYGNNTITITGGLGVAAITKVELVHSGDYYSKALTSSAGTVTMATTTGGTTTVTSIPDETVEITLTAATGSGHDRFSSIKIYYTEAAVTDPIIQVKNTLDFGTKYFPFGGVQPFEVKLPVVGLNLTNPIVASTTSADLAIAGELTKDGGELTITVSAAPGNFSASIMLTSDLGGGAQAANEVTIQGVISEVTEYEVSVAINGADGGTIATNDFIAVRGVVTKIDLKGQNFANYGSANIYIADATGAEGQFEYYNCYSLNADTFKTTTPAYDATSSSWASFDAVADGNGNSVELGDTVVAWGKYAYYNSTYELNTGCYLVSIKKPGAVVEPTYYLKNNWEGGDWVWNEMTKVNDDQYKLENVVFGGSGVNWNTAESDEGASWVALEAFEGDIIKALDTVNLILTPSTGAIYATLLGSYVAPATNTYTAAGSSAAIFGTAWDPTVEANDLTLKEGTTIYEKVYTDVTLAAGTVSFKVCVNHAWTTAYPASDYNLTIPEGGIYTVTITYDSSTNAVSATAEKTGSAVVIPTIKMHGTFDGSWADTEEFTMAADEQTASLVIALAVGDVEFGVKVDGAWTANGATLTREAPSTSLATGSGNMHLTADVAGNYTFTWTYATQTLAVEFPEAPVAGCDWDNIEFLGDGSVEQTFGSQFKVCVGDPAPNVVNIQTPGFAAATGIYVTFPSAAFGAISLANDQYVIDGAGMVMYLSAFTATETEVTVNCQSVDYIFTVYNAKGTATAIVNNTVEEKVVKFIENGQLFIRKNGKTYNAQGAVVK